MKSADKLEVIVAAMVGVLIIAFLTHHLSRDGTTPQDNQELEAFHNRLKDAPPAYTLEDARAMAREILPWVEAATGKPFKSIPPIQFITTQGAADLLARTGKLELRNGIFQPPGPRYFQVLAKMLLGVYDHTHGTIYLLPQRLPVILKLLELNETSSRDIARMVIAHELTHALQDQYMDFSRHLAQVSDTDELFAFKALVEGHATWVEKEVAGELGIDDFLIHLSPLADTGKIIFHSPALNQMVQRGGGTSHLITAYSQGVQFINYHHGMGGRERLWELIEHPPVDPAMILYPWTYQPHSPDPLNYQAMLHGIYDFQTHPKGAEVRERNFNLDKLQVKQWAQPLSDNEVQILLTGLTHCQTLSVHYRNQVIPLTEITFMAIRDEEAANTLAPLIEKIIFQHIRNAKPAETIPWKDLTQDGLIPGSRARMVSSIFHRKINGQQTLFSKSNFLMGYKDVMVMISDGFFELSPREATEIATKVIRRYYPED